MTLRPVHYNYCNESSSTVLKIEAFSSSFSISVWSDTGPEVVKTDSDDWTCLVEQKDQTLKIK